MDVKRSRFVPGLRFGEETLESRLVLSGIGSSGVISQGTMEVAAQSVRRAATVTTLAVSAGTLGQPITMTATVRAAASAGSPAGTVQILDHGQVIQTITPAPMPSTSAGHAMSGATTTLTQPPGGAAYYFGKHQLEAVFVPTGSYSKSTASRSFTVSQPAYNPLSGGVKVATITQGSGAEIQSGQTANVLYTGYLTKNGQVFDDSLSHGGAPFGFTLGAGQVVPGFDEGTAGMQVGETRIISMPPAEGYGQEANGSIPANSSLIFVVTLQSIS